MRGPPPAGLARGIAARIPSGKRSSPRRWARRRSMGVRSSLTARLSTDRGVRARARVRRSAQDVEGRGSAGVRRPVQTARQDRVGRHAERRPAARGEREPCSWQRWDDEIGERPGTRLPPGAAPRDRGQLHLARAGGASRRGVPAEGRVRAGAPPITGRLGWADEEEEQQQADESLGHGRGATLRVSREGRARAVSRKISHLARMAGGGGRVNRSGAGPPRAGRFARDAGGSRGTKKGPDAHRPGPFSRVRRIRRGGGPAGGARRRRWPSPRLPPPASMPPRRGPVRPRPPRPARP